LTFFGNLIVRLRKVTAKPTIAIARIAKVETITGRLKKEKIRKKNTMKTKPKKILKLVLTMKSNEAKGSFFFPKARINRRIPEPTK
jgi:hypothetical protein